MHKTQRRLSPKLSIQKEIRRKTHVRSNWRVASLRPTINYVFYTRFSILQMIFVNKLEFFWFADLLVWIFKNCLDTLAFCKKNPPAEGTMNSLDQKIRIFCHNDVKAYQINRGSKSTGTVSLKTLHTSANWVQHIIKGTVSRDELKIKSVLSVYALMVF